MLRTLIASLVTIWFIQSASAQQNSKQTVFNDVIIPILKSKCFKCHGNGKDKGDLEMNTYEQIITGGEQGTAIIPGNIAESLLISTLLLPIDDEAHMPPSKKPQPSKDEITILKWWVASGASKQGTLNQLSPPSTVTAAIDRLRKMGPKKQSSIENLKAIAEIKRKAALERSKISKKIIDALPRKLRGMLRFESPLTTNIRLSSIAQQDQFNDADFSILKPLQPYFVMMDLSNSAVTSQSYSQLSKSKALRELRLSNTSIRSEHLKSLLELKHLRHLSLHSTAIDDEGLQIIGNLSSLQKVILWNTKVSKAAVESLRQKNPKIEIVF